MVLNSLISSEKPAPFRDHALRPRDDDAELVEGDPLTLDDEPVRLPLVRAEAAACSNARSAVQREAHLAVRLELAHHGLRARFERLAVRSKELDDIGFDPPAAALSSDRLDEIHGTGWTARQ